MSEASDDTGANDKKAKKNILTVLQRTEILKRIDAGASNGELAAAYSVSKFAIVKIKQRRYKILAAKNLLDETDGNLKTKRFVGIEGTALEKKLYSWFLQRRDMGYSVSGPILQKQASLIASQLENMKNFKASCGWLDRFKKRHGIRLSPMQADKLSVDPVAGDEFKQKLRNIMEVCDIKPDYVYNCDETALYWNMIPDRTFIVRDRKYGGGGGESCKQPTDRISAMLCTNATGTHKLPIFLIGKTPRPHCFRNVKNLPVVYHYQSNAWMSKSLILKWYTIVFLPEIMKRHDLDNNKNIKILLIMNSSGVSCHPSTEEFHEISSACTVHFLPPNVSPLVQPMDQGIIEKFTKSYKHILLSNLLSCGDDQESDKFVKSLTLLDCSTFCALAWDKVSQRDIRNCWNQLIPLDPGCNSTIECIDASDILSLIRQMPQAKNFTLQNTIDWLNFDAHEVDYQPRSDDNVIFDCYPDAHEHNENSNDLDDPADDKDNQLTVASDNHQIDATSLKEGLKAASALVQLCQNSEDFGEFLEQVLICEQQIINRLVLRK